MKNIIPVVMAGVLGIYGLIVSVIIAQGILSPSRMNADQKQTVVTKYSSYTGWCHLAAGLSCGLSCLAAGGTIGIIGDVGTRAYGIKASGGRRWWDRMDAHSVHGGNQEDGGAPEMSPQEMQNEDGANQLFVGLLIMLIFAEALGLYGLIVALILSQRTYNCSQS